MNPSANDYTLALAIAVHGGNSGLASVLIREICSSHTLKQGKAILNAVRNNLSDDRDRWLISIVEQIRNGED